MTTITIPPEALEAAARAICEAENGPCECLPDECGCTYWQAHARAAILAALEAWNPSWTETECDNAGDIVSRVYVLDITPEENADAET